MAHSPITVATAYFLYNHVVSRVPSYAVRHAYLRRILKIHVGVGAAVHMGCFITGRHITVGDHSVINRGCYLDGRVGIALGNNVSVSAYSCLLSLDHDPYSRDFRTIPGAVTIEDYVWIGMRAMVLPGVTVREGCVVGAGAVVTTATEPYTIVAGVPARPVGTRPKGLRYVLDYRPYYDTDTMDR